VSNAEAFLPLFSWVNFITFTFLRKKLAQTQAQDRYRNDYFIALTIVNDINC